MNVRTFAQLMPHAVALLAGSAFALTLPACDCAGDTNPMNDAGDTGVTGDSGPPHDSGPPRDSGPDTGARDSSVDAARGDAGPCGNPETCNGVDDDCDGFTDENIAVSCGSSVGVCRSGTQACSSGTLGVCMGGVMGGATDICGNGLDDNCDGHVDESCACTDGATQNCGSGVGECRRGTQTCASATWGTCIGEVAPSAELCDGLDNNCDGLADETFPGVGGACDGADADMCAEGTLACSADHLGTTCSDTTGDSVETCNGVDDNCNGVIDEGCTCTAGATQMCGVMVGACTMGTQTCAAGAWGACVGGMGPSSETCDGMDNNCDGTTDEGFGLGTACDGPDADACTEGVVVCSATGGVMCNDATGDAVETCNNMDDDCDGNIDEGNPGATTTMIGTCVSQMSCVGGALVSRGTFVSAAGVAANPGTSASPVGSINAAITNAVTIGGGADVCVCDPPGGTTSTFTENVTMVQGVSVLGGLDCASWTLNGNAFTAVQDTDANGLSFPAGITSVTALDHMTVVGFDDAAAAATTAAITITDGSPTLSTDTVRAGRAATAIALRIVHTAATTSPSISGGTYSAVGIANGTATAVAIEGASPAFTNNVVIGGATSGGPSATTAYGIDCSDCAGTTIMGGSISTSGATMSGTGLRGTGGLAGLAVTGATINGGQTNANNSTSAGVSLVTCTGAPTFTTVNGIGGNGVGNTLTGTTRTAFATTGPACAPVIDGGQYRGCEVGVNCFGIDASNRSAVVIRNVLRIIGSSAAADVDIGVRCGGGACASITRSTIAAGTLSRTGPIGIGLSIDSSSPRVDSCVITGPNGGAVAPPALSYYGLLLRSTASVVTNNVIHDGTHQLRVVDVLYDMTSGISAGVGEPTFVNNTLDYTSCPACGPRVGIAFFSNNPTQPRGIFRNNLVHNLGAVAGTTNPVIEANVNSDPRVFENNALFDVTAATAAIYFDEGMTSLTTAAQINALTGAAANLVVDCLVNATFHLPMTSACVNTGTATTCPAADFEAQARPFGAMCDIGADEFHP